MLDFLRVKCTKDSKTHQYKVYPSFVVCKSKDLMIRGSDFYAVWDEDTKLWSTDEDVVTRIIDNELYSYYDANKDKYDGNVVVMSMRDSDSKMIDKFHHYVKNQMRDNFHPLDEKIIFANMEVSKEDYATKSLSYSLEAGDYSSYDKMMSTLYSPEERHKIEWAIGSVVTGESKDVQKFLVMYGPPGTGKSTVLNIIELLFEGYYAVFDSKALANPSNQFALEPLRSNPRVGIEHDGDLSRIEDNTRLNSIVSHESMAVNEKFKSSYTNRFTTFLFLGTNKPVKITDAKSGILRRLIDVSPTGEKLSKQEYTKLNRKIKFELGAIAYHCKEVYEEDRTFYDDYVPLSMLGATNDFFNFILEYCDIFLKEDGVTQKAAWEMYKEYSEEAKLNYPYPLRVFKEELKSYFKEYLDRFTLDNGDRVRSYYHGFRKEKLKGIIFEDGEEIQVEVVPKNEIPEWLKFKQQESIFDKECSNCSAQYGDADGKPIKKWDNVKTSLKDIDTSLLHYVRVPENHIVIDFDIRGENGEKALERNLEAAKSWPETYAEVSKSGEGVHLHYIYNGDVERLSRVYSDQIEIKVFTGKSSLRRKLSVCNDLPIASISSGLPVKGVAKMINKEAIKTEKQLIFKIEQNLKKIPHGATKPSIDYIEHLLEEAYNSGMKYDVTDMRQKIFAFASHSTNQAEYCMARVGKMKFKSDDPPEQGAVDSEKPIIFFDCEVFPNLLIVNWKFPGDSPIVRMINPSPSEIGELLSYNIIGFNNRRYDNHILYAALLGKSNYEIFMVSQRIIGNSKNAFFSSAWNASYTDIYDFCSDKKSLKKWEIELGIHHQELGIPWDQEVPKHLWAKVAEYCDNDVIATEAVFNARKDDWIARQILADLADGCVNDTTNMLTTKIILGNERNPQSKFNYRDLSQPVYKLKPEMEHFLRVKFPEMMAEPHGEAKSLLPYFPGYSYENGVSTYRGDVVGEGGRVWAMPGMYSNVVTFDVASMHPHSITSEYLFGDYTLAFNDLIEARVAIKHKDFERAGQMLGGRLKKYLSDSNQAKTLSKALKLPINSVYGLTAASFEHPFHDPRNVDNIVAKRGALFMMDLMAEVQKRGGNVIHIKTDSIKVEDPSPEIQQFILDFGKRYGYTFEIEHKFEKICLVNNAVYIAKVTEDDEDWLDACEKAKKKGLPEPTRWTATGAQFAVPYVFKTLFSKEPIDFKDLQETKQVTTALYLDMNEDLPEGEHDYNFVGKVGLFCPVKPGCGGGLLLREKEGKYSSATGANGYRWMEAEAVEAFGKQNDIDRSYYNRLVDDAKVAIEEFGDFEWFIS